MIRLVITLHLACITPDLNEFDRLVDSIAQAIEDVSQETLP